MSTLNPVNRDVTSLRQQVTERLRSAIIDGRLTPGQKLIERELCQLLDVSRTLLRETLQQLQAEGLITAVPHKGPSVAIIGIDEVTELYDVREALEALAGAGFARNASDSQVKALREQLEILRALPPQAEARELLLAKSGFYAVLLDGCGNRVVKETLRQLTNRTMLFRRLSLDAPGRMAQMLNELEGIVAAIEARDPPRAAALCAAHVVNAGKTVLRQLAKTGNHATTDEGAYGPKKVR
jgi:DNA-binding GntR family transcriptional regulator